MTPDPSTAAPDLDGRIAAVDWDGVRASLDERGFAPLGPLLTPEESEELAAAYDRPDGFRSRVVMARHGFGSGEYKYFAAPLPPLVQALREGLYPNLADVAREWAPHLGLPTDVPSDLDGFLATCARNGQTKPTPLLLRYGPTDYNCLHQDLYGDVVFPLQVTVQLSRPGVDFTGGHFLLVEQRPRMQSRGEVVDLAQGEAVVFATRQRPAKGRKGRHRTLLRHGVTTVRSGRRTTLGIIFHDAA